MASKKKQQERRIEREFSGDGQGAANATPTPTAPAPTSRHTAWIFPLLILLIATAVNVNTLWNGFTWDDQWLILDNTRITDPAERWGYVKYMLFERDKLWRPLKRISLLVDYAYWGREHPGGFHATNVALATGCALAGYWLVLRLTERRRLAFLTALLFAVHPVHVESVANISHRKEPMSLLFSLLAFIAYLAARSGAPPLLSLSRLLGALGITRGRSLEIATAVEFSIYAGFLYFCGILSKEVGAIMVPVAILAWELANGWREWKRRLVPVALCLLPLLFSLGLYASRGYITSLPRRFSHEQIDWTTGGKTQKYGDVVLIGTKALAVSTSILVWPSPLYLDRTFQIPTSLEARSAAGFLLLAISAAALGYFFFRARVAFFALFWFLANYLPVSGFIPLTHWLVAERFLYVPSFGFVLLVALALDTLWDGRVTAIPGKQGASLAAALSASIVLVLAGLTVMQNRIWRDSSTLWAHTLKYNPDSYRGLYGYGLELDNHGEDEKGAEYYLRAMKIEPSYPEPHYALALLLLNQEKYDEAIAEAKVHAKLDGKDPEPYLIIGNAYFGQRQYADAARAYDEAVKRNPKHADALYNLANAWLAARDYPAAAKAIERALVLRQDSDVYYLSGTINEQLGQPEIAQRSYAHALDLSPNNVESLNAYAGALARAGKRKEALTIVDRSLQVEPDQAQMQELRDYLAQRLSEAAP